MRWFQAYEDQASFNFHFIKSYISEKTFLDSSAADYSGEIFTMKMTKIQRSEFEANFYEIALTVTLRIQSLSVRTVTYQYRKINTFGEQGLIPQDQLELRE